MLKNSVLLINRNSTRKIRKSLYLINWISVEILCFIPCRNQKYMFCVALKNTLISFLRTSMNFNKDFGLPCLWKYIPHNTLYNTPSNLPCISDQSVYLEIIFFWEPTHKKRENPELQDLLGKTKADFTWSRAFILKCLSLFIHILTFLIP